MSDLRERVARAMYDRWRTTRPNAPIFDNLHTEARESEMADASAAIAIVLEEAAQCAQSHKARGSCLDPRYPSPREIAAAIRALAGGKTHE